MSFILNRSTLLRAAVLALSTAAMPALAETDYVPLSGNGRGALAAWAGPSSPATAAVGPAISVEPGSIGDVHGASAAYVGRTPLASAAAQTYGFPPNINVSAN